MLTKKRIFLITFLCIALVIWGWISYQKISPNPISFLWKGTVTEKPLSYETSQKEQQDREKSDLDLSSQAIREQDAQVCQAITDTTKKTYCLDMIHAGAAQKSDAIEWCSDITDTSIQKLCRDNIFYARAEKTKTKHTCEQITDESLKASCQKNVDTLRLDLAISGKTVTKELCDTLDTTLSTKCQSYLIQKSDTDTFHTASMKKTVEGCDPIVDATLREKCQDAIRLDLAIGSLDTTLCNTLSDVSRKELCQKNIREQKDRSILKESIQTQDITGCKNISDTTIETQCRDQVILLFVRREKNADLCVSLSTQVLQESCQKIVAN